MLEVKPRKIFEFKNIKFAIVEYPKQYMNSKEPLLITSVVHYYTGVLISNEILRIDRSDSLKLIIQKSIIEFENLIKSRSKLEFLNEFKKFEYIN